LDKYNNKKLAAILSIAASFILFCIKIAFGLVTNSLSIVTSAVDSFLDLSASVINYYSIYHSSRPADKEHRYGHEKAEAIAGLFQSFIIITSTFFLIFESIKRLNTTVVIQKLDKGIAIMLISLIVSYILSRYLKRVAIKTESIALHADSFHFKTDLYTNLTIITGLVLVKLTGLTILDSLITILVSSFILYSTYKIIRNSLDVLMDRELSSDKLILIENSIKEHSKDIKGFHKLRTRNTGSTKFIEFHLEVNKELSFIEAHDISEEIIKKLELLIPNSEIIVHVDPSEYPDYS
jgi:cation diffusion facilitator family transporter